MKTLIATLLLAVTLAGQTARDVTEFTLFKRKEPVQVGDISMVLKDVDINRQRYKVLIIVDGHTIEKKDMDIKVPFFFYGGKNDTLYELVVTKVAQDQITGRLISPK